jgi:hypothetical protein
MSWHRCQPTSLEVRNWFDNTKRKTLNCAAMPASDELQTTGAKIRLPKGRLAGVEVRTITEADLRAIAQSPNRTEVAKVSFYKGTLKKAVFQGINFTESNFARVEFEGIAFSRCKFRRVDFTRANFKECTFSECTFIDCDPYYASFEKTEIDPSAFRGCFTSHDEWNKALILFSRLLIALRDMGETRFSRVAEYYFRVWQRRRLYHRWRFKRIAGFGSWFWSLCIGAFTGYGERPIYLAGWALLIISAMSEIYMKCTPDALPGSNRRPIEYWYYSFKIFFAQGLTADFQSLPLMAAQIGELTLGLVMVALLIGSVSRKLSP